MKVIEETPERLLIDHTPWLFRAVVWGMAATFVAAAILEPSDLKDDDQGRLILGGMGLALALFGWFYGPRVSLLLDSRAGVFEHHETRPLSPGRLRSWPLTSIRRARQQTEWRENSRSHRLALETDEGIHALERGYSPRDRREIADRINDWLRRNGLYRES